MRIKSKIANILILALWITIGSGVIVLLVAAMTVKTGKQCKGFQIDITGAEEFMFLDKDDLVKIITKDGTDALRGKPLASINLGELEAAIAKNIWVRKAELFFDNNLMLHINVVEKEPLARIFTKTGASFYLDSSGGRLPLSNKMSVKLPVFTNFPEVYGVYNKKDSALVHDVKLMSAYILHDDFWMAQVAQVNCDEAGCFEIVPMLGNHQILFGNGENYESKFKRLALFYKEVLSQTGIDKYAVLNVTYNNQVVATKKPAAKRSPSILPPVIKETEIRTH